MADNTILNPGVGGDTYRSIDRGSAKEQVIVPNYAPVMCTTDVVLPTSTVYSAFDALSNSTTAPTSGGFTWTGAAGKSGGGGIITDVIITSSNVPATKLAGELWVFDRAVTNINDNAVFGVSDLEIKTLVGIVPFTLFAAGNNSVAQVTGLGMEFVCNGSANLRFLIRCRNAYTPATDTLTCIAKILQLNF